MNLYFCVSHNLFSHESNYLLKQVSVLSYKLPQYRLVMLLWLLTGVSERSGLTTSPVPGQSWRQMGSRSGGVLGLTEVGCCAARLSRCERAPSPDSLGMKSARTLRSAPEDGARQLLSATEAKRDMISFRGRGKKKKQKTYVYESSHIQYLFMFERMPVS